MPNTTKRITTSVLLVGALIVTVSAAAQAEPFGRAEFGVRFAPGISIGVGIARPFNDPFWGPYEPYGVYPGGYPYVGQNPIGKVRVEGVPQQTEVIVDGYFAGTAGTIAATPGGHAITLFLPGYRTVTENIYVRPGSTFEINATMDKLGTADVSAPPSSLVPPAEK